METGAVKRPTRMSLGVILCRRNEATGRPEALLVHKRYTYAFAEFIHGRYARGAGTPVDTRRVAAQLAMMTREELYDVLSLNFEQMWYRIWLTMHDRDQYRKKCAKFQATFMRDGGAALRRLVMQTRARGSLLWEPPKGRRLNAREPDVVCATRELREETGVSKSEYRLLPGAKRRVCFVSGGTRYIYSYYIALANPSLSVREVHLPSLRDTQLMAEVSEVRWHDIERIRVVEAPGGRLEVLVAPAFRLVKQYLRGRWAGRRPAQSTLVIPSARAAPEHSTYADEGGGWQPARRRRRARWRPPLGADPSRSGPMPSPRR